MLRKRVYHALQSPLLTVSKVSSQRSQPQSRHAVRTLPPQSGSQSRCFCALHEKVRAGRTGGNLEPYFRSCHFGTIQQSPEAAVGTPSVKRLAVRIGARLKLDVSGTGAGVNVTVGEDLEEVLLKPRWAGADASDQNWRSLDISSSDNFVDVRHSDVGARGTARLVEVNAEMPGRWCSLDVLAGSGRVYVQSVREGDLRVTTKGGSVKLGEMKGSEARIDTGGGDVEAGLVQAESSIRTGGGRIRVKRLQGLGIAVDSAGGDVAVDSLYGDRVTVDSGGGSVDAKEIQAQGMALVSSDGGKVAINGLDGKAVISSRGGDVELQLNEHAEDVTVDGGEGGRVILRLSAGLTARLRYEGSEGVVQEGCVLTSGDEYGIYDFTGSELASGGQSMDPAWRGSEVYSPGSVAACKIHIVRACQVSVKQRSWIESVTSRIS